MLTYKIQLADESFLQADKKGDVLLLIKDVLYEPKDLVPREVFPEPPKEKRDARTYVLKCCVYAYGPNHSHWPELAKSFVENDGRCFQAEQEKSFKSSH